MLLKDDVITPLEMGGTPMESEVRAAGEDSEGSVWLYTADGQLRRHRKGRLEASGERPVNYRALLAQKSGALWVDGVWWPVAVRPAFLFASERRGYWRLAGGHVWRSRSNEVERDFGPYPWKNAKVASACEDRQGNLLVGTLGAGLFWFDAEGNATCLSKNQDLSDNYILSLHVDREGSLWV